MSSQAANLVDSSISFGGSVKGAAVLRSNQMSAFPKSFVCFPKNLKQDYIELYSRENLGIYRKEESFAIWGMESKNFTCKPIPVSLDSQNL